MFFLPSHHDNYGILTAAVWAYCHPMPIFEPVSISAEVVALRAWLVGARWVLNEHIDALSRLISFFKISGEPLYIVDTEFN